MTLHDEDDEDYPLATEGSKSDVSSSNDAPYTEEERDEVQEVREMSSGDTRRIRVWRFVVTGCLLITGVAITLTTHKFLVDEQESNFETAFEQFSRTIGDAAVEQQGFIRDGFKALADTFTAYAQTTNATWPFVTLPLFELHAKNFLIQSGAEIITLCPLVKNKNRKAWIEYTNKTLEDWVKEGHMIQKGNLGRLNPVGYNAFISKPTAEGMVPQDENDSYFPSWMFSPPPSTYGLANWDLLSIDDYANAVAATIALKNETIVTPVRPYSVAVPTAMTKEEHDAMHSKLRDSNSEHPHSFFCEPVHEVAGDDHSPVVAVLGGGIAWDYSLRNLLPEGVLGIVAVVKNSCGQSYTYEIDGQDAVFLGEGDSHDLVYDSKVVVVDLALHTNPEFTSTPGHCRYSMHIYPSTTFKNTYDTNTPELFAGVIACVFVVVIIVFFVYDMFVQRRNENLVANAARSNAIVSSLFPGAIRDRLINNKNENTKSKLTNYLKGGDMEEGSGSKPLADLFLETTVLFADIVGFTAWSSVREPSQVFSLLESVYSEFDDLAKKRRVFKVETVGDCYVAVTGLPDPCKDHAVAMSRFARDILVRMQVVTRRLETSLGPDTGDLGLRVGLHSGPVTAGVLRGERARFQLFGDTVNTCSRIESTGISGRIHLSAETAALLAAAGKADWSVKRQDCIQAKGKGELQTYWLATPSHGSEQQSSRGSNDLLDEIEDLDRAGHSSRTSRLIDWNVEKLVEFLKQIVARREASGKARQRHYSVDAISLGTLTPLEEVKEIITLPAFDSEAARRQRRPEDIELPQEAIRQLRDYVFCIASMYRDNPFHNFDHASHVVMSVTKLMGRIVAPNDLEIDHDQQDGAAASLHDHTYGITSDPLTQFACAFSALIHDVDHRGIPNTQLIQENQSLGARYSNRSVAEQNSLDLAWDLLMDKRYADFRMVLCANDQELQHFRRLVVNSVMATDIMDKELKELRNARWDKAFKESVEEDSCTSVNRKATIVIEHLIQASDVSHTMQHWHVYRKWNENLFKEMYRAYKEGRSDTDPSTNWYKGEIGFLDFYVIPLAKKLKNCGVFGVSSDEYLNYVTQNRQEWEARGQEVVAEMIQTVQNEGL